MSHSGCLRPHLHITDAVSSQPNLPPALLLHQHTASFYLSAHSHPACFHQQQCLALSLCTTCWFPWLHYPLHCPPDPIGIPSLCPSLCLPFNHHSLCFSPTQSQDPANLKTWLMELSLLLITWAPLSCCLRGTPQRTYAWCRPRRLSAGSRYSKDSHWLKHPNIKTHKLEVPVN